jgi:hypothetical protein
MFEPAPFSVAPPCPLPPCGGGLGRGVGSAWRLVAGELGARGYPPPQPSPTRGEGVRDGGAYPELARART